MKRRLLYHPLWTHAVAVALVGWMVVDLLRLGRLPARVPVHFDFHGQANRYGSPWEVWLFAAALPLAYLAGSMFLDELWARHEDHKRFNFFALLDEALIGFLGGMSLAYFQTLAGGTETLSISWPSSLGLAVAAVALAAVLESLRPHRAGPARVPSDDADQLQYDIRRRITAGGPWAFWQVQNPAWLNWLIVPAVAALAIGAVSILYASDLPAELRWLIIAAMLLSMAVAGACYGGLRVMVTPDLVRVRLGVFGIPLLRLRCENLAEAKTRDFSPLADYGGWGIRWAPRSGWGFFFRGSRGVLLTTKAGKHYLVGSDRPEILAAAIRAAMEGLSDDRT